MAQYSTAWAQDFTTPYHLASKVSTRLGIAWVSQDVKHQPLAELQLSQQEYQRYLAFPSKPRRNSFLMGRMAIKQALGAYLDKILIFSKISILNAPSGAPYMTLYPLHLSLSHVKDTAVALVSRHAIPFGIDLESSEALQALSDRWLNVDEIKLIENKQMWQLLDEPLPEFMWRRGILWVAKEAIAKLLGTGLALDWDKLSVQSVEAVDTGWLVVFRYFLQFKVNVYQINNYLIAFSMFANVKLIDEQVLHLRLKKHYRM